MNIQGVNILSQKIIYSPQWFGAAAWICAMVLGFFFLIVLIEGYEMWAMIPTVISFILFLILIAIAFEENHSTFLNKPSKVQYEIEITDDNAWKELGPNYDVLKKLYENKEIYRIEGVYVDDNT